MRIVLAALVFALAVAGGAGAQSPQLVGTVGPGASIRMTDAAGNQVRNPAPGTYTVEVRDQSPEHNFHLAGPGVDEATDVEQTGTFTWTVTFSEGSYRFQCDVHPSTMRGTLTVGTAPPSPVAPPPAAGAKLAGSVGPGKKIALTRAGVKVGSLKAGAATLVVRDLSATDNFHLTGPGVNRATTKAGKGTFTWKLALKPGLYRYRSDATPTLRGSFRVAA